MTQSIRSFAPTMANFAMSHQPSYAKDTDRILYNWSGLQYIAHKEKITYPRNTQEIAQIMRQFRTVRVIGAALSYEPITSICAAPSIGNNLCSFPTTKPATDRCQFCRYSETAVLSLSQNFVGLIRLSPDRTTATFHAATPIDDVIHLLAQHGYMMTACPGVIGVQTLAGSISTGTHGQGLYQSDYADMVQSFTMVLADGTIKHMTPEDPLFYLYLISLGTLGIFTEIEVSIRPRLLYTCTKCSAMYEEFLQNYQKWNEEAEFCKVWWFPNTDMCQVWLVNPSSEKETAYYQQHKRSIPLPTLSSSIAWPPHAASDDPDPVEFPSNELEASEMNQTVRDYMRAMAKDTKVSQQSGEPQFLTLSRFMNMQTVIGWNEQLVTKGIPVPQINCEISIPLAKFRDATNALRAWNAANPGKLHYPFIYRVAGASKARMSASHRGPVVWIGFLVYISQSGSIRHDGMSTMFQLQKVLAPFDGLPHWGKHFHPGLFEMDRHYGTSTWRAFKQEMRRVDPTAKLTSQFLNRIFFEPAKVQSKL